ncbi:cytochrome P450 3A24-like isoform X2 [Amblyomma americanum]
MTGLLEWLLLAGTAFFVLYLYAGRNRNYWKSQNVIHEPFSLLFGPASGFLFKPVHAVDQKRYAKMGRVFGYFEGDKPALMVGEPDLVKLVLVKDFPALCNRRLIDFFDPILDNMMSTAPVELWRKIRPSTSPAFSTGKLRRMNSLIQECAMVTSDHLKKAAEQMKNMDMKEFYGHYALDVIASCAFGTKLDSYTDAANQFVTTAKKAFSGGISLAVVIFVLCPGLGKMLKVKLLKPEPFHYFKEVCVAIIQERKRKRIRREDFLQLMMDAQEGNLADGAETAPGNESAEIFNLESEVKNDATFVARALSEDEALAQCVLFFLAGHDGTSSVLACAARLLALNPEAQATLRAEADECFATHGRDPSLDAISRLPYLHCVVSETLRLYPPAPRIDRTAHVDYVLGGTGIIVPKGSIVAVPVYAMHHDPEFFPDPEKFIPERFSDDNASSIRPYSYLPFGAGPRNCVGMRLALQTVKLALLHSVHSVEFVATQRTKASMKFRAACRYQSGKECFTSDLRLFYLARILRDYGSYSWYCTVMHHVQNNLLLNKAVTGCS